MDDVTLTISFDSLLGIPGASVPEHRRRSNYRSERDGSEETN